MNSSKFLKFYNFTSAGFNSYKRHFAKLSQVFYGVSYFYKYQLSLSSSISFRA
ncbi:hypothetical protein CAMGR0001_0055 [Campylobacter gracilis RM3268]|uniref:Uncharacterized protein n=1 Tax=Campylobacter gracilis RM3268 TaxID=553220 RepID=C8PI74_9BACT|nr:hypothetical protein CAMGR0001_0055 [Campylobacter gracilis RM3268]